MISEIRKLKSTIGIVSISGPLAKEREELAFKTISSLGYKYFQKYSSSKYYSDYTYEFTNGSPQMRLDSILSALEDKDVDFLLASRGSTGSLEIIEKLPFEIWSKSKKTLVGESDITSLLVQFPTRCGIPSIHGPTFGSGFADYFLNEEAKESVDCLIKMLTDSNYRQIYSGVNIKKFNLESEGKLLAGNLSMLVSLLGTSFDIDYTNSILILEDVNEAPYRVKRMLNQMYLAGKFKNLKGLCFGRFSQKKNKTYDNKNLVSKTAPGPGVDEVINKFCDEYLANNEYPILTGIEVGHWGKSLPVPIGCAAVIKGNELCQLQSPLQL